MKKNSIKIIFLVLFVMVGLVFHLDSNADQKDKEDVPEEYIIKESDTLWNISDKFFKDPFLWPYIWQNNDYITNPDIIYPGNKLLLKKIKKPPSPGTQEKKEIKVKKKTTKPEKNKIVTHVVPEVPKKVPVIDSFIFQSAGFIARENLQVGSIIDSPLARETLSKGDIVYTDVGPAKNAFIGKKYSIYRIVKEVEHPVNRKKMGFLINVVGVLEVREIKEERSTALITSSYEDIGREDFITDKIELEIPMIDPMAQQSEKDIQGYIIEAKGELEGMASGNIVYLDVGEDNGIAPGDRLVAVTIKEETSGKVFKKVTFQYPKRIIGELKVISTRNETSTAIVTKTDRELNIGEKVEYQFIKK